MRRPPRSNLLSLHDALPILQHAAGKNRLNTEFARDGGWIDRLAFVTVDRGQRNNFQVGNRSEGTRLNSSHSSISYAVFCLKKKKKPTLILLCHPNDSSYA